MAIMARDNQKEFTAAPEGLHQAVCVDVVDLGLQETPWGAKPKVELRWQIDQPNPDNQDKPFLVVQRYGLSLHEKATLRKHLEAWRGKKFSREELDGFDLEKLLGANGQLQIIHNLGKNGGVFANVQAIVPLGKGMPKFRPVDYVRVKDRTPKSGGETAPDHEDDEVPF